MAAVKGAASLRRMLRRLPDEARKELGDEMVAIGNRLLGRAKMETPVRTGALRAALGVKVLVKSLQLRLGLIRKADQKRFFYGYILDAGRKAKSGTSKSGRRWRVTAIPASRYNFVFGRRWGFKQLEIPRLRAVLDRVLLAAARGSGND